MALQDWDWARPDPWPASGDIRAVSSSLFNRASGTLRSRCLEIWKLFGLISPLWSGSRENPVQRLPPSNLQIPVSCLVRSAKYCPHLAEARGNQSASARIDARLHSRDVAAFGSGKRALSNAGP